MIRVEAHGAWDEAVLDRPDRRNALDPAMLMGLTDAVRAHGQTPRVLLVRGEGRVFCAGFDLALCKDDPGALDALLVGLDASVRAMRAHAMPVVLCAHGAAVAGGCALLGGADVVVGDEKAKLGYPVLRLGISPAVSAPWLRLGIGNGRARERLMLPELIDGGEAKRIGLIHEVEASPEGALARARAIAGSLAEKPAGALAATKAWLNEVDDSARVDGRGLNASRALVGGDEERRLLPMAWQR